MVSEGWKEGGNCYWKLEEEKFLGSGGKRGNIVIYSYVENKK